LTQNLPVRSRDQEQTIEAIVAYEDAYVQPLIVSALQKSFRTGAVRICESIPSSFAPATKTVAITAYEAIDFEHAAAHPRDFLINSYMIRKALIRKHFLSTTIDHWTAKNPDSILKRSFKRSEHFEVDYAEFLDDALVEAFDLRESMERNEEKQPQDREWWILKPGMSDRGQGIKLFSSMEELQGIFDQWEEERPDSDDEGEEDEEQETKGDYITTSHLRHFVAQPYIHPPLLLPGDGRKFHIRTYVCCVGALRVYVYQDMLALFAAKAYKAPYEASDDIETFLTNTCLQSSPNENTVQLLSSLPVEASMLDSIRKQIGEITGELFEAAARAMPIHFQPLPNAFEVFGLDFLVDEDGGVWGLEVNAFPDFRQTGGELKGVVEGFWEGVVDKGVKPFFGMEPGPADKLVLVRSVDLGR
jgi:tubulin---tyrosine ligase